MIIKAMEISEAVQEAVFDEAVKGQAMMLVALNEMGADKDTFMKALFAYSALLSATVGDKVTKILLSEEDLETMLNEINEFADLTDSVLGESHE